MTEYTTESPQTQIDAYLQGTLGDQQQVDFELAMFENPELAREVELHQLLGRSLKRLSKSDWSFEDQVQPQPGVLLRLWQNSRLAWLTASGFATALLLGFMPSEYAPPAVTISDAVAIHSYRGASQEAISVTLTNRSSDNYLLLSIDTPEVESDAKVFLISSASKSKLAEAVGTTDDVGSLTVVLPTQNLPTGLAQLQVQHSNGSANEWTIDIQ